MHRAAFAKIQIRAKTMEGRALSCPGDADYKTTPVQFPIGIAHCDFKSH